MVQGSQIEGQREGLRNRQKEKGSEEIRKQFWFENKETGGNINCEEPKQDFVSDLGFRGNG